jgi:hypothetical protein
MKKYIYIGVLFVGVISLGFSTALAQGGFSVGARVGTTGIGGEVAYGLTERVNVRAGVALYDFTVEYTTEDRDPDVRLDLESNNRAYRFFVDYLPFKRFLRLTGGFVYQGPEFKGKGTPIESYTDPGSGVTIPANQMGSIELDILYEDKFSPYLGIGFGNSVGKNRLTLSLDAGVIFTGKPDVESRTFGPIADVIDYDPSVIRDDAQKITLWPLLSVGVALRLF